VNRLLLDQALEQLRSRLLGQGGTDPSWSVADRVLLEQVADHAVPFGLTEAADALLAALQAKCREETRAFVAEYLTLKRTHVALTANRFPQALELLRSLEHRIGPLRDVPYLAQKLPSWEQQCHWPRSEARHIDRALFFSRLYLSMGQWLAGQGRYGHAAILLERGRTQARPPSSPLAQRAWLPLSLSLAAVYLEQGRFQECGTLLAQLQPHLDDRDNPAWSVQWLELSGQRDLLLGRLGTGVQQFGEVTAICARGGFERATLAALLNQARIHILLNQVHHAEGLLTQADNLAAHLQDRAGSLRIRWLQHLAEARSHSLFEEVGMAPVSALQREQAQQPAAGPRSPGLMTGGQEEDLSEALFSDLPQPGNYLALFEERALAVQWALGRGDVHLADDWFGDLEQTFGECESPLIQLRLHLLAGMIAYDAGEYENAARIFEEVCPPLQERGLIPDLWQAYRFRAWCAARLEQTQEQEFIRRTQRLLVQLASSLPAEARAIYLLNKWTVEENALGQEIEELIVLKQQVQSSPWYQRPWKRWQLGRRLHAFLWQVDENRRQLARSRLSGEPGAARPPSCPSLWRRLWDHPRDSATVSFLVLPDRVFIARAAWLSLDFAVMPLTRLRVRELVARWHQAITLAFPQEHFDLVAEELAEGLHLEEILQDLPPRVTRLSLVADDSLHGFPFAALPFRGEYLIDSYALTMKYDRSEVGERKPSQEMSEGLTVAVAQGTSREVEVPGEEEPLGVIPLPHTIPEIEGVADWLEKHHLHTTQLRDGQATRLAVLQAWSRAHFIHTACHGKFLPDQPGASGLVLIPAPERIEILSLCDLSNVDMSQLQHVTLSCCWGADNFVHPGRWIFSLPETLCRQGARSVLACLWPIDDEVGQAFSMRFYHHLAELPRDQALQKTQLECRQGGLALGPARFAPTHPKHWAGYRLHGSGDVLPFGQPPTDSPCEIRT
jgi:CHAT domain-containing protein